jgi:galactose mutarotase-like enzyme
MSLASCPLPDLRFNRNLATFISFVVPGRARKSTDIVRGLASATAEIGATIGRDSNRIAKGKVTLNGREHRVPENLHSSPTGFHT